MAGDGGAADRGLAQAREALGEVHGLIGEIRELNRGLDEDLKQLREELRGADEERAEQARRGELGPDWARLQRRIDLNQTSVSAVVRGEDASIEAERLRTHAGQQAHSLAQMQEAEPEEGEEDETGALFGVVRQDQAELRALVEQLQALPVARPED
ncbi:MAG TPA: hypothetical protein VFK66_15285 [Oryzihumus sp.]|nr:hypothetical protein [Oryzihumus sp.]